MKTIMKTLLLVLALTFPGSALAANCPAFTYTLTNGTTADANQVMSNFNTLLNCSNSVLAPLNSPTFVTPVLGSATATAINGLTISTTTAGTLTLGNSSVVTLGASSALTIAAAKTAVINNSLTLAANDGATANFGNGLTIASGKTVTHNATGTFAGVDGKTLTLNDSTTLGTSAVTLANGKALTLSDNATLATASFTLGNGKALTVSNSATLSSTAGDGKSLDIGDGGILSIADAQANLSSGVAGTILSGLSDGVYFVRSSSTTSGAGDNGFCIVVVNNTNGFIALQGAAGNAGTFTVSGTNLQQTPTNTHGYSIFHTKLNF